MLLFFSSFQARTVNFIPLDNNESAFSIAVVSFAAHGGEQMLVVGTAQDTFLAPRSCTSGFLRTYRIIDDGQNLELLHKVCFSAHRGIRFTEPSLD